MRLVIAAAHDVHAAAWPIGSLAHALEVSGRVDASKKVWRTVRTCRTARFGPMAAKALALIEQQKAKATCQVTAGA